MQFAGSHILSISQFERTDVERLFTVADAMRPYAHRERVTRVLDGAILGSMFSSLPPGPESVLAAPLTCLVARSVKQPVLNTLPSPRASRCMTPPAY